MEQAGKIPQGTHARLKAKLQKGGPQAFNEVKTFANAILGKAA
jgi:hypothetical protein